jgi:hypothetical protein
VNSICTRTGDCEADASHWPDTPCGRRNYPLCPGCGFPAPHETDDNYGTACPHGWRTATIADFKGMMAEAGIDTKVTLHGQ